MIRSMMFERDRVAALLGLSLRRGQRKDSPHAAQSMQRARH